MSDTKQKKYSLYAVNAGDTEIISAHRFYRLTPTYALVYCEDKDAPAERAVEVTEAEMYRLTHADRQWLYGCNAQIIREETRRKEADIASRLREMVERFGAELEKESRRINGKE